MQDMYPAISKGYGVFIEPHGGYILSYEEQNGVNRPLSALENVNIQACAILEQCTGSKTVTEIVQILEQSFENPPPDLLVQVSSFLDAALEKGYITCDDAPVTMQGIIHGSTAYYTPSRVLIEVTRACNLACGHCLLSAGTPLADELSVSQFIAIADGLFEMGVPRLTLSGGEILTKSRWEALLDFCVLRFDSVLLTNSILVTEDAAKELKRCGEVRVSLYGADPETYEKFSHVKGSFQQALKGIALLINQDVSVSASIPMTPFNLEQLEDIITLAISLQCTTAKVGTVIPLGRARTHQWELEKDQNAWLEAAMVHLRQKYKDSITIEWEEDFEQEEHKCGAGYTRWTIASNGDVYPCGLFRIPIGNLSTKDPVDICTSPEVEFLQEIETPHDGICGDCPLLHRCRGCHGQAHAHWFRIDDCRWIQQFDAAPELLKREVLKRNNKE